MKKLFILFVGILWALSFVGMGLSQEKTKPSESAKVEKRVRGEEKMVFPSPIFVRGKYRAHKMQGLDCG